MNNYKIAAALIGSFALGAGAASVYAQGTAPYYEVAEINVKDQAAYEASGVDKVREAIKAAGGKVIAGGYKKAELIAGNGEPANRFLITMYPNRAASGENWAKNIRPWLEKVEGKYATARVIGVEGVEQK
jgi:uncharacterized protein (DUF1330 family)